MSVVTGSVWKDLSTFGYLSTSITHIYGAVRYHKRDNMAQEVHHLPTLIPLKSSRLGAVRTVLHCWAQASVKHSSLTEVLSVSVLIKGETESQWLTVQIQLQWLGGKYTPSPWLSDSTGNGLSQHPKDHCFSHLNIETCCLENLVKRFKSTNSTDLEWDLKIMHFWQVPKWISDS